MSELADIRRMVTEIHVSAVQTARDVSWIKEGMAKGSARMDGQDQRIDSLAQKSSYQRGWAAGLGSLAGAVVSAVLTYVLRHHA